MGAHRSGGTGGQLKPCAVGREAEAGGSGGGGVEDAAAGGRAGASTPEWVARLKASAEAKKRAREQAALQGVREIEPPLANLHLQNPGAVMEQRYNPPEVRMGRKIVGASFKPSVSTMEPTRAPNVYSSKRDIFANNINGKLMVDNDFIDWPSQTNVTSNLPRIRGLPTNDWDSVSNINDELAQNVVAQGSRAWPTQMKKQEPIATTILITTPPEPDLRNPMADESSWQAAVMRRGKELQTSALAAGTSDGESESSLSSWRSTSSDMSAEGERRLRGRGRGRQRRASPPPPSPPRARSPSPSAPVRVVRLADAGVPLVTKDLSFVDNRPVGVDNSLPAFLRRRGAARAAAPPPTRASDTHSDPATKCPPIEHPAPKPSAPVPEGTVRPGPTRDDIPDRKTEEHVKIQQSQENSIETKTSEESVIQSSSCRNTSCATPIPAIAVDDKANNFSARAQSHRVGSTRARPLQIPKAFQAKLIGEVVDPRRLLTHVSIGEDNRAQIPSLLQIEVATPSSDSITTPPQDQERRTESDVQNCQGSVPTTPQEGLESSSESEHGLVTGNDPPAVAQADLQEYASNSEPGIRAWMGTHGSANSSEYLITEKCI